MDIFLGKVTQQAMNYAIRSGVTITASYALKQSSRFLKTIDDSNEREELQSLQERLDSKIKIISPAIDMIELISARGNTSLESAVSLTKAIRWEIQNLGQRLAVAASAEEEIQRKGSKSKNTEIHERELKAIVQAIRKLLTRIEDAVPLINLAITASGASLSSTLPSTVSPSRLLQASTFLTAGDSQYGATNSKYVQIGPTFTLSMYMLFMGHIRLQHEEDIRETTWKEIIHKANIKLMRVPINALYNLPNTDATLQDFNKANGEDDDSTSSPLESDPSFSSDYETDVRVDEYAYQMVIVEDLDDDRVHTFEDDEPQPGQYSDVLRAGIREVVPIHELSKIFYADTGKILNIGSEGETNNPILLLKRDPSAAPPRRMMDRNVDFNGQDDNTSESTRLNRRDRQALIRQSEPGHDASSMPSSPLRNQHSELAPDPWRLPPDLDPEWIAFEVYTEAEDSDAESETDTPPTKTSTTSRSPSVDPQTISALSRLSINTLASSPSSSRRPTTASPQPIRQNLPPIRTSLSLLETLLRLLSLQQFQQTPHLSIPDELLNFFLSESASTGAASDDAQGRRRLREEARRHVGFDPYDESPVKRRGEEYQYRNGREGTPSQWNEAYEGDEASYERYGSSTGHEGYGFDDEGYHTYQSRARSLPVTPRNAQPQTPLLLTNRSRTSTPERYSASPSARLAPKRNWRFAGVKPSAADGERRGSPLAQSASNTTDEGLGTSPTTPNKSP